MAKSKKIKHISFTQLSMLLRCGEQYRRRYVLGQKIPPSGVFVRGRCCHKAEAENFTAKIKTKKYLSTNDVLDIFSDEWEENKGQIAWHQEELDGMSPRKAAGKMKDSGVRLIKVFNRQQLMHCNPIEIESEFKVEFEGGYRPMIGRFDRIDKHDIIAEEKFVRKSPHSKDIHKDVQMTAYDLGYRARFGKSPKMLMKQWAVDLKTPKTVIQKCPPRSNKTIQRFLRRLEAAMLTIKKGNFLPAANEAWCCDRRYCGFYDTCKVRP